MQLEHTPFNMFKTGV